MPLRTYLARLKQTFCGLKITEITLIQGQSMLLVFKFQKVYKKPFNNCI